MNNFNSQTRSISQYALKSKKYIFLYSQLCHKQIGILGHAPGPSAPLETTHLL